MTSLNQGLRKLKGIWGKTLKFDVSGFPSFFRYIGEEFTCIYCNGKAIAKSGWVMFCSSDCRKKAYADLGFEFPKSSFNIEEGKRIINNNGYVEIFYKGRWVVEHRLVVALHLGRQLKKGEQIHHKDGNRSNNDLSNLELRINAHGSGFDSLHSRDLMRVLSEKERLCKLLLLMTTRLKWLENQRP